MLLSELLQHDYMRNAYNATMTVRTSISAEALAGTDDVEGLVVHALESLLHSFVSELRNTSRIIREEGITNDIAPHRTPRRRSRLSDDI